MYQEINEMIIEELAFLDFSFIGAAPCDLNEDELDEVIEA